MIGMVHQVNQLPHAIPIGVQTENGVESVGFVVSAWQSVYGVMDFSVWATRPGEDVAYEVQHTELVGSILYWYPDEVDTAIAGVGKVEVKGTTNDKRKLSGFCETVVQPSSLAMTQDPPKVVIPWLEDIKEYAEEAKKIAEEFNLPYVMLQEKLLKAVDVYGLENIFYDGIHPNLVASKIIADEWIRVFKEQVIKE